MREITIIGGGVAGLALGVALRKLQIPVAIFEAGGYPRHRVCGEFISGQGQAWLKRQGLFEKFINAGAVPANTIAFFTGQNRSIHDTLPQQALCLSRFVMDDLLAREFTRLGGHLHANTRWPEPQLPNGAVRATGRRVQAISSGWRWFGLKCHARNIPLEADLEVHLLPDGYAGLARIEDGMINLCALHRSRQPTPDLKNSWINLLTREAHSSLAPRLAQAEFDRTSFCSIAGLPLSRPCRASVPADVSVGDSIGMIPPLTGNGLSLAFESAELAAEPLADYSRGHCSWEEAAQTMRQSYTREFSRRFLFAGLLHRALFSPVSRKLLLLLVPRMKGFLRLFFKKTR